MNLKPLSKTCSRRFARLAIALIASIALLLICLTACRTSQKASESSYHRQLSLTSSDSSRTVDLSVTHDTISIIKTETLWREPDTAGRIYPLMTTATETTAKRQTDRNVVRIRADTIAVTDNTDHIATATAKSSAGCFPPREGHPFLRWLPWVLLAGVVVIISHRIR